MQKQTTRGRWIAIFTLTTAACALAWCGQIAGQDRQGPAPKAAAGPAARPARSEPKALMARALIPGRKDEDDAPAEKPADKPADAAPGDKTAAAPGPTPPGGAAEAAQPVGVPVVPNAAPTTQQAESWGFHFPPAPAKQSAEMVAAGSMACVACHTESDTKSMHAREKALSCVDCHGGHADLAVPAGIAAKKGTQEYAVWKYRSHVQPQLKNFWKPNSSANPEVPGAKTLDESADYIRFVNPGDLRAAAMACAACHADEVSKVRKSMMVHGAMLWEAALYNNGSINQKIPAYGESYGPDPRSPHKMVPHAIVASSQPTAREVLRKGYLPTLWPIPRWEVTQPGNILRVFENGAKLRPIIGEADPFEDPGRPDVKLSIRGFGTDVRTDPVFIGLQKTRLFDPTLSLFGTNDHAGDYRASGCSACHVNYANDRSAVHSGKFSMFGNRGQSFSKDTTVSSTTQPGARASAGESGHPIQHSFVKDSAMPSSTCIVCHVHPGTNVLNSYLGYMWWDNETDGQFMYPAKQRKITTDLEYEVSRHNPEGAASRGLWSDQNFLNNITDLNPKLKHTYFADFHGHGWVFRAVWKQDRKGNLIDHDGKPAAVNAASFERAAGFQGTKQTPHPVAGDPVHLKDIHLEKGMQCTDCHFRQDTHGDGNLYGETRNAVEVDCVDCHGTMDRPAAMFTYLNMTDDQRDSTNGKKWFNALFTGNAASRNPNEDYRAQLIRDHFKIKDGRLYQINRNDPDDQEDKGWYIVQTSDSNRKVAKAEKKGDKLDANVKASPKAAPSKAAAVVAAKPAAQGVPAARSTEPLKLALIPGRSDDTPSDQPTTAPPAAGDNKGLLSVSGGPNHEELARFAHTVRRGLTADGKFQYGGDVPSDFDPNVAHDQQLAHGSSTMSCFACHSSWNTSCFGCHLPQRANQRKDMLHNETLETRNYTNYNFQTLRDDIYMLGVDSVVKRHKIVPIRSACAVMVSSQDALRQWIYLQQQTVSAEGYSGTAFSPYFPHTVRTAETKQCVDCHLSSDNNNNAIVAQLLLQGTNAVNFTGRWSWVAAGKGGLEAVVVGERDEPQAVIGSKLHSLAYPSNYEEHQKHGLKLEEAEEHDGDVLDVQLRGEYLYAACGREGFIAYDVANVDNKGFSEKIISAPVSPLGQKFFVKTKYATSICSPSTLAIDPTRAHRKENGEGRITEIGHPEKLLIEQKPIHLMYAFLYVTDREEGLVVIGNPLDDKKNKPGVATLLDGDPNNNFLQRAYAYNPNGLLTGAKKMAFHGTHAYVCATNGIAVLDMNDPLHPKHIPTSQLNGVIKNPRSITFQFRYAFVCDDEGVKVLDVTDVENPRITKTYIPFKDARDIYVSRTWGYVAAGKDGMAILDLENPEAPKVFTMYNAGGELNDTHCVRVGITNNSMFAYVADGRNGLKVLQLTSEDTPGFTGYSAAPVPKLIARHKTHGPALSISEGLDRDRAVDEAGNQLSVFGRRGARPFTLEEQQRLYLHDSGGRKVVYKVPADNLPGDLAVELAGKSSAAPAPAEKPAEEPERRIPGRK